MNHPDSPSHVDVLVIGAGLSGISAAWHLQNNCPELSWTVVEARDAMGGTWDLFRYPGIRSDSDMYTLGYRFRPWSDPEAIADGPAIKSYIEETADEYDITPKIRFRHRVVRAEWDSERAWWTVEMEFGEDGTRRRLTCGFIYACTGYYRYDRGYTPEWEGTERFQGPIIHPQRWPEDLNYAGKRVVVIGSGATAVTLVPAMLEGEGAAGHVVMLQRSPTYIARQPTEDRIANALRRWLPDRLAYTLSRWKNILRQMFFFKLSRWKPEFMKRLIRKSVVNHLGEDYDVDTHFAPRYDPWDQRLCIVPDGDLFEVVRDGRAWIVTDRIETFTETGLRLQSGQELAADLIVTATGLQVEILSGIDLVVDGKNVDLSESLTYKGMMYSDIPNLASAFGYTNASWTLKCDLVAEHVCRILNHMRRGDFVRVTPRRNDPSVEEVPALDLNSGYIMRVLDDLPSQGSKAPWRLHQNYVKDLFALRYGRVDDPALEFVGTGSEPDAREAKATVANG